MKIKTTIAFESLRDAEGKGGMYFVIIYAQKDDSLIFRRRKDRLKGRTRCVCLRFITSSFHQVSVYTNQRPETGAGRNDSRVPHHFL